MKIKELKPKSRTELEALLGEKKTKIGELRFLLNQKKVKNVREIAAIKKDVARILTLLKETSKI